MAGTPRTTTSFEDTTSSELRTPESTTPLLARTSWRRRLTAVTLLVAGVTGACDRQESEKKDEAAVTKAAAQAKTAKPDPVAALDAKKLPELGPVPVPEDRPQSKAKIELGHRLFFDERLSVDGSRSCYGCHQNEQGTGGEPALAVGAKEKQLTRHSPTLWNVAYLPALYWDGRADSLEAQASAAWAGANMGVGQAGLAAKAAEIGKIPGYAQRFAEAFPQEGVTPETIVQAISAYERTLVCEDTAYDRYAAGNKSALTQQQKEGLTLFMGKAGCATCHAPPHFTTASAGQGVFFNTGVGVAGVKPEDVDVGRKKVTERDADHAAFKPPTLRNITKTAPYFHDGSAKTLEEAVRFMASGGHDNEHKSPLLADRKLTAGELTSLTSFLEALDCPQKLERPDLP